MTKKTLANSRASSPKFCHICFSSEAKDMKNLADRFVLLIDEANRLWVRMWISLRPTESGLQEIVTYGDPQIARKLKALLTEFEVPWHTVKPRFKSPDGSIDEESILRRLTSKRVECDIKVDCADLWYY